MSLFINLLNKKHEDLSTEILVYLLSDEYPHHEFKYKFYDRILGDKFNRDNFVLKSQINIEKKGVPDIIGVSINKQIIIENKLISFLSGDDQLVKYIGIFGKENSELLANYFTGYKYDNIINRLFIVIAPENIQKGVINKTNEYVKRHFPEYESFIDYCKSKQIEFVSELTWNSIVNMLNTSNIIEKEFKDYINEYLTQSLSLKEVQDIENNGVTRNSIIDKKLNYMFSLFAEELKGANIKPSLIGGAKDIYFHIEMINEEKAFFGYFKRAFDNFNMPLSLSIKENINCTKLMDKYKYEKYENEVFFPFKFIDSDKWLDIIIDMRETLIN